MRTYVECPACEDRVEIASDKMHSEVHCYGCGRDFIAKIEITGEQIVKNHTTQHQSGESFSRNVTDTVTPELTDNQTTDLAGKQPPSIQSNSSRRSAGSAEVNSPTSKPADTTRQTHPIPDVAASVHLAVTPGRLENLEDFPNENSEQEIKLQPLQDYQTQAAALPASPDVAKRIRSRKQSKTTLIMTLLCLIGLIATFGVLYVALDLIYKATSMTRADDTRNQPLEDKLADQGAPLDATVAPRVSNAEKSKTDAPGISTEPNKAELPETFTMRQFRHVWQQVNSYLVKLDVETPAGKHVASGLVIDSRGWIATSYSAIQNATSIKVTLASRNFDSGKAWRDKTFPAKGVIATDQEMDLAIVSADSDLVISLVDVPFEESDHLVGADRLIVARSPPADCRLWFSETRVDERPPFSDLEQSVQQEIRSSGLVQRENFGWIKHSLNPTEETWGAPIFDREGNVVALNTALKVDGMRQSFAVPVKELLRLKETADNTTIPFGTSSRETKATKGTTDVLDSLTGGENKVFVHGIKSEYPEILDLSDSLKECSQFHFFVDSFDRADQLRNFAIRLRTAADLAVDVGMSQKDRDKLTEEINDIMEQVDQVVANAPAQTPPQIKRMNNLMLEDTERSIPVVIFGVVDENAATSPEYDGKPTVFFQAAGTADFFFAFVDADSPVYAEGDRYLIFATLDTSFRWVRDDHEVGKFEIIHMSPISNN